MKETLAALQTEYRNRVAELAGELAPSLRAMQQALRAVRGEEGAVEAAAAVLERACKKALCATVGEARLVLALSPSYLRAYNFHDIRDQAALAVALDVARLIDVRWFDAYYSVPKANAA